MNKASSGKTSQLLIVIVLVATLLFGFYYYIVGPKKDESASAQSKVNSLNTDVKALKTQIAAMEDVSKPKTVDLYALRKKVPQTRAVDQLLLNIEQMEFVVGARVESISFNNYDSLVASSPLQDPNQVAAEEAAAAEKTDSTNTNAGTDASAKVESAETTEKTATPATPVSTISPDQLPPELKMLTLNINVEAPNYESLLRFILEVESLERVVRVDTISYSLPTEQERLSPDFSEVVTATIQVTTFYYEGEK